MESENSKEKGTSMIEVNVFSLLPCLFLNTNFAYYPIFSSLDDSASSLSSVTVFSGSEEPTR